MKSNRGFGFRQVPDTRDMLYTMRGLMGTPPVQLPTVIRHKRGPVLDQGAEGACVGFSLKQILTSQPFEQRGGPSGREIYVAAREIDEFDDSAEGTSIRAGCEVLKNLGLIQSYHWAPRMEDLLYWIGVHGPAEAGIRWHQYATTFDGQIRFDGPVVGLHAIPFNGYDLNENVLFSTNSWGPLYGFGGDCFARIADIEREMRLGASIAGIIEKPLP